LGAQQTLSATDYCREIEAYLCRKNDGHLIRIVGPSFELVSRWETDGVPLKVAFGGIDRYFERYYRKGPRRRPVRIDFCDADVRDVFDEWRRAVGIGATHAQADLQSHPGDQDEPAVRRGVSLPAHLERVLLKLSNARATGRLGADADSLVDRVSRELDLARSSARGLRGEARQSLIARLAAIDGELLRTVRSTLSDEDQRALAHEVEGDLSGFRAGMQADAYERARDAAIDRLVRERFGLPTLTL
jgi:hypothetical protein